mgnify:CR=1 FL=1
MNDKEIEKAFKKLKKEVDYSSKKVKKRIEKNLYFWNSDGNKVS